MSFSIQAFFSGNYNAVISSQSLCGKHRASADTPDGGISETREGDGLAVTEIKGNTSKRGRRREERKVLFADSFEMPSLGQPTTTRPHCQEGDLLVG